MSDPSEFFDPAALQAAQERIVRCLERHGTINRRYLQRYCSHRDQSADLFAAALTVLLDQGTVTMDDQRLLTLIGKSTPHAGRTTVPEWDRSGRRFRRAT